MQISTMAGQAVDAVLSVVAPSVARKWSDQPKTDVLRADGDKELRRYAPMLVACVTVNGTRDKATDAAFSKLSGFIFGKHTGEEDIAMTVPVQQAASDHAVNQSSETGTYVVRFMMPHKYTLDTLPKPKDPSIRIEQLEARELAVITYSGKASDALVQRKTQELKEWMGREGLEASGPVEYGYYDPPFTPPPLRRNEVLFPVAKA